MVAQRALGARAAWAVLLLALALPAPAATFLWEVVSMTSRAYLFGTVHAGKETWYPLPPAVEQAFADSNVIVVEADITNEREIARTSGGTVYSMGDALANHVPPEDYARFLKLLPRYGLLERDVATLKPFIAVSLLVAGEWGRLGYQFRDGVDVYLIRKARAEMKPVVEIEGLETQGRLMDSLGHDEHRRLFEGILGAVEEGLTAEQIEGLVKAWQAGDPKALLEVARRYNEKVAGARELEEKFIWSRHDEMLGKIEGYLADKRNRHFIAVGSLHLAGPRGLVEQLRRRGYVVKQH